jgi:hypothetical protein
LAKKSAEDSVALSDAADPSAQGVRDADDLREALDTTPTRKRGRKRKAAAWCMGTVLLLVGLPLLYLSMAGASFRIPDWAAERIETELNESVTGAELSLGQLDLIFDTRLRPRVQMRNVAVADEGGVEIAMLDQVSARLSPTQFFRGAATMKALNISGAIVTVRRDSAGQFDLVLGQGRGAQGDLAVVLDSIDAAFSRAPLNELGEVTADHVTITLEDARSGRLWQVTDGRIALTHSPDRVALRVDADVFNGTEDLASTAISFEMLKGSSQATLTATFENALATDIAAQSPVLSFLSVLDAPISGALRTRLGDDGAIEDLAGTLRLGAGALQPTPGTPPITFESARAYLDYDPALQAISLTQLAVKSETATLTAEGTALLQDYRGRWPSTLVGQFQVADMTLQPKGVFAEPMVFDRGAFDFRMRLDPFSVDIGQVSLGPAEGRLLASGQVQAQEAGWRAALDLSLNQIRPDRVLSLWPVAAATGARDWVSRNVKSGEISDLTLALRFRPDAAPKVSMSFLFEDAVVTPLKFLPPVTGAAGYASMDATSFTTVVERGTVTAPQGGEVEIGGTYFKAKNLDQPLQSAEVVMRTESSLTAALSLLNQEPLAVLKDVRLPVALGEGRARGEAELSFDLINDLRIQDVVYAARGTLDTISSTRLIEGRSFEAPRLSFTADPEAVVISGAASIDGVPVNGAWSMALGPAADKTSQVSGTMELSQRFLDAFSIALPPGTLRGAGLAQVDLALTPDAPPRFELSSDLNRLGLNVAALGWSKAQNRTGSLEVVGRLGEVPSIDRLALSAPGLSLSGVVDLNEGGGLARASFDRVRVGGWLDAPVTLVGRGATAPPAVQVTGGTADLRNAAFGASGSSSGAGGGPTENGPLSMRLDRLTVSDGIALTNFRAKFEPGRGLRGQFSGAVNGAAPVTGSVLPTPAGAAIQIRSDSAGEVLAAAGILRNARRGAMDLTLNPTGGTGVYDGRLSITNTRMFKTDAMTDLLNAISIVGLIDQMNSGGILLSDVEAGFQLSPQALTLYYASAVGPSIGVSLDGVYGMASNRLDMQGVISPVYFLNGIGQIFSRGRDGLFGFNFRMTGEADDPRVSVNPLSILTPGAFREIFRRPPPTPSQ